MTTNVKLVVGLGNPGSRYQPTRHNAGVWFVERLARVYDGQFRHHSKFNGDVAEIRIGTQPLKLLRPDTFMNDSGRCVGPFAHFYKIPAEEILVAYDELDLAPGVIKLRRGGGGSHNGIRDVIKVVGRDFLRLRIGIGHPGHKSQVTNYVLGRANQADQDEMDNAVEDAVRMMPRLFDEGEERARTWLHSRKAAAKPYKKPTGDATGGAQE